MQLVGTTLYPSTSANRRWLKVFNSRKREFRVYIRPAVVPNSYFWDGGSKTDWYFVTKTGVMTPVPVPASPFSGERAAEIPLTEDRGVVALPIFRGKPGTPTLYLLTPEGWDL